MSAQRDEQIRRRLKKIDHLVRRLAAADVDVTPQLDKLEADLDAIDRDNRHAPRAGSAAS